MLAQSCQWSANHNDLWTDEVRYVSQCAANGHPRVVNNTTCGRISFCRLAEDVGCGDSVVLTPTEQFHHSGG